MARLLKELNPSVQGHPDPRSAKQVLEEDPAWFRSFGLVIVCGSGEDADVGAEVTRGIGKALWEGELQVLGWKLKLQLDGRRALQTDPCGFDVVGPCLCCRWTGGHTDDLLEDVWICCQGQDAVPGTLR
jgi:hypothetical protein